MSTRADDAGEDATEPRLSDARGSRLGVLPYASRGAAEPHDPELRDFAFAAFVCGVFVFIPFITGLMSLVFGIAVLRRGRRVRLGELGTAVLGTLMGAANLAFWALFFFFAHR